MDLILSRKQYREDGIFGELRDESDELVAVTLEHAFKSFTGGWIPIIPQGIFECVRGIHHLHQGAVFETFEVTGVKGHFGLLLHWGNFNKDSEGCILLGQGISFGPQGEWITHSHDIAFKKFMELQDDIASFQLLVG